MDLVEQARHSPVTVFHQVPIRDYIIYHLTAEALGGEAKILRIYSTRNNRLQPVNPQERKIVVSIAGIDKKHFDIGFNVANNAADLIADKGGTYADKVTGIRAALAEHFPQIPGRTR